MKVSVFKEDAKLTLAVSGRIDTVSSKQLSECISENIEGIEELVIDMAETNYISSSGLRAFLSTKQQMMKQDGSMKIINVQEDVMEIFDMVGLSALFELE